MIKPKHIAISPPPTGTITDTRDTLLTSRGWKNRLSEYIQTHQYTAPEQLKPLFWRAVQLGLRKPLKYLLQETRFIKDLEPYTLYDGQVSLLDYAVYLKSPVISVLKPFVKENLNRIVSAIHTKLDNYNFLKHTLLPLAEFQNHAHFCLSFDLGIISLYEEYKDRLPFVTSHLRHFPDSQTGHMQQLETFETIAVQLTARWREGEESYEKDAFSLKSPLPYENAVPYRGRLAALTEELKQQLPSIKEGAQLQSHLTAFNRQIHDLLSRAFQITAEITSKKMGPLPCHIAVAVFGSLGRFEAIPLKSDLDFAIVSEKEASPEIRSYFEEFVYIFSQVRYAMFKDHVHFCEEFVPLHRVAVLNQTAFLVNRRFGPLSTNRESHLREWGHKELINTPETLFAPGGTITAWMQTSAEFGGEILTRDYSLPGVLTDGEMIWSSSEALTNRFTMARNDALTQPKHRQIAKQTIKQAYSDLTKATTLPTGELTPAHIQRPVQLLVQGLAHYFNVKEKNTAECLRQLRLGNHLPEHCINDLDTLWHIVLRYKTEKALTSEVSNYFNTLGVITGNLVTQLRSQEALL